MFVYVSGIEGVGKTTLIKEAVKFAQKQEVKIERVDEKAALFKIAGVNTVLELQNLPNLESFRKEIHEELCEIDKSDPDTIRLVDGQFVFNFNATEKKVFQKLNKKQVLGVIIIFASVPEIINRRAKNLTTQIDLESSKDLIVIEQKLEINASVLHAETFETNFSCVHNDDPDITTAARHISSISQAWFRNFKSM